MIPATRPRRTLETVRLLALDARERTLSDRTIDDLPDLLRPGDLLVVNDAATLPASLAATTADGEAIEVRLLSRRYSTIWQAVLLGRGDWRTPTELRDPPPPVQPGTILYIEGKVALEVTGVEEKVERLVTVRFTSAAESMWTTIYAYGRPTQYSYIEDDLALWAVQTAYASRPWAAEMPSAGQPLSWKILLELRRRGVSIATVTHAAGISSVGEEELDARLPLPERFDIPQKTIDAVAVSHASGGRVIAVGTTVVRAIEGCAAQNGGRLVAGEGTTDLVVHSRFRPSIVDGILTGVHDPAQSHFRLLRAFADETILRRAWRHATAEGYRCHEFGDVCLIIA